MPEPNQILKDCNVSHFNLPPPPSPGPSTLSLSSLCLCRLCVSLCLCLVSVCLSVCLSVSLSLSLSLSLCLNKSWRWYPDWEDTRWDKYHVWAHKDTPSLSAINIIANAHGLLAFDSRFWWKRFVTMLIRVADWLSINRITLTYFAVTKTIVLLEKSTRFESIDQKHAGGRYGGA